MQPVSTLPAWSDVYVIHVSGLARDFHGGTRGTSDWHPFARGRHSPWRGHTVSVEKGRVKKHMLNLKKKKIELLERLHSENTHHHPMITDVITSYLSPFISSQNKTKSNLQILENFQKFKFCKKLNTIHSFWSPLDKMYKYEMDPVCIVEDTECDTILSTDVQMDRWTLSRGALLVRGI